jgi:DNA-binding XRE family transcriptional regulator
MATATLSDSALDHVEQSFAINRTELAALFGVRRQAIEQWRERGVPGERQLKLARLGEIADFLALRVKADRIPAVVRRAGEAYGDRSILAAVADGDEDIVLDELHAAFDWSVNT